MLSTLTGRGLAVFPISAGQREAPPGWQQRASRDPHQPWPASANLGVGCRASGIVVLDLDRKNGHDGISTLTKICDGHGQPWPGNTTYTVSTPNDGLHLYFLAPPGIAIASTIGQLGPGIDVRAPGWHRGGYVLGAGSFTAAGPYLACRDEPIAALPAWLIPLLRHATPPSTPRTRPCAARKD
jgi:hypothetical protein